MAKLAYLLLTWCCQSRQLFIKVSIPFISLMQRAPASNLALMKSCRIRRISGLVCKRFLIGVMIWTACLMLPSSGSNHTICFAVCLMLPDAKLWIRCTVVVTHKDASISLLNVFDQIFCSVNIVFDLRCIRFNKTRKCIKWTCNCKIEASNKGLHNNRCWISAGFTTATAQYARKCYPMSFDVCAIHVGGFKCRAHMPDHRHRNYVSADWSHARDGVCRERVCKMSTEEWLRKSLYRTSGKTLNRHKRNRRSKIYCIWSTSEQ